MQRAPVVLFLAFTALPRAGWTQGGMPIGPEFRVNTYTTSNQSAASVSADPEARFVVVWQSYAQDGSGFGVFGQRYFIIGSSMGPEFRVNTYTTGYQSYPSAAMAPGGAFVVVWSTPQDGSGSGIFGQRFNSGGAPVGAEFRVNGYTTSSQGDAAVATDLSGNFVVVWTSFGQDGSATGVYGQRYANSGVPLGPEFRVNTVTTGDQYHPAVAFDWTGNFVVVWQEGTKDSGVSGQRYDSAGAPAGPQFQVEAYTTGVQRYPAVAADASGDFVVVWHGDGPGDSGAGVFGQRYSSGGSPAGPEFRVNTYTTNEQTFPAVASDGGGNFVVTWTSLGADGAASGVFGQRYDSAGTPFGSEFRVNTHTTDVQSASGVASIGGGTFVVVWQSQGQDGSLYGIFGQRYNTIVPVELMDFTLQ